MGGICKSCKFFKADLHEGTDKPHHCDFQNVPLNDKDANTHCDECKPNTTCAH